MKKFDVGVIVWGTLLKSRGCNPKAASLREPQQINFTMTTNRDVMGASAISNLNLTICEKKMTPSMVKYKAVMYIYTPDLRLLHRKSIFHGVAKHVL